MTNLVLFAQAVPAWVWIILLTLSSGIWGFLGVFRTLSTTPDPKIDHPAKAAFVVGCIAALMIIIR